MYVITEKKLRKIIRERVDVRLGLSDLMSKIFGSLSDGIDTEFLNLFNSGDMTISYAEGNVDSEFVMPVPVFNGTNYAKKVTSEPQEVRTDVGNVTDSSSGKTSKRGNRPHRGYDFGTPVGTPILAIDDGVVYSINTSGIASSGGKHVSLKHSSAGLKSSYMHMNSINIKKGESVKKGQIIGLSGKTGKVTGPHLHFSLKNIVDEKWSYDKSLYDDVFSRSSIIDLDASVENSGKEKSD